MSFRDRLVSTIRAAAPALESPGIMIVDSEVPSILESAYATLRPELRHTVVSNLTLLSMLEAPAGMPDPGPWRERVAALIRRLEAAGGETR